MRPARLLLMLGCLLGTNVAHAGEKTFMSGEVTLIHKPFALIEPYLGKPMQLIERQSKAHQWIEWGDGSQNMFFDDGLYKKYIYAPVRLVVPPSHRDQHKRQAVGREYNCKLDILVGPDGMISGVGKSGDGCTFELWTLIRN